MNQPQQQPSKDWQEAATLVRRLESELHDMTPAEQDFVMGVLGGPALMPEQIECLRQMAYRFDV